MSQRFANLFGANTDLRDSTFSHFCHTFPSNAPDNTLKVANSGLARVIPNEQLKSLSRKLNFAWPEAIFTNLTRDKIALGDLGLFLLCVARQGYDLHAIQQGAGDRIKFICCR